MAIPVFYLPNPEKTESLSIDDSFHANKVLRLKTGDPIFILDGQGKKYKAILTNSDSKKSTFSNLQVEIHQIENTQKLNLWIAPTKQMERMEWMIEKCTEMGIQSIGFFIAKNSERKEIKLPRLEKIVISAIKQSKQLFIPQLHSMQSFDSLVEQLQKLNEHNGFAYINSHNIINVSTFSKSDQISNVLIGPEGDFSENEIKKLFSSEFQPFTLGNSILRTETAGLLTTAAFALKNSNSTVNN